MTPLDREYQRLLRAKRTPWQVELDATMRDVWGWPGPRRERLRNFLWKSRFSLVEGLGIGCTFGLGVWWLT